MSNNDKFIGHSDDPLLSGVDIENAEIAKQYEVWERRINK